MRRFVPVAVLVALILLAAVYGLRSPDPAPPPPPAVHSTPVVRLHRGSAPVRAHETPPAPRSPAPRAATPAPTPSAPTAEPEAPEEPERTLALEDLDPDARQALGKAAMEHLHELADACESTLTDPEDVGAFVTLDHDGVVELELKAIGRGAGPISVEERELPQALVDCLDDTLWSQDWSAAGPAVPAGASLPLALTMRLDPGSE